MAPTAKTTPISEGESTPYNFSVVPLSCVVQVPSSVKTIVPESPTAQAIVPPGWATEYRSCEVVLSCDDQALPLLKRIVPLFPTTKIEVELEAATVRKV